MRTTLEVGAMVFGALTLAASIPYAFHRARTAVPLTVEAEKAASAERSAATPQWQAITTQPEHIDEHEQAFALDAALIDVLHRNNSASL